MSIRENLEKIRGEIEAYSHRAGISPLAVELVGVSKTVGADQIQEAYGAGLRMFGENRVQEYVKKSEILAEDIKWNLIGQLQTNKVKYIMNGNTFLLHSLDRLSLAEELQKQGEKRNIAVDALVQVNLAEEETKAGLLTDEVDAFMDAVQEKDRIRVKGIMTIGPMTGEELRIRHVFAGAKRLYDRLNARYGGFEYLSMGMSHDFGWAILEGSNMVRIGTAVFGERNYE